MRAVTVNRLKSFFAACLLLGLAGPLTGCAGAVVGGGAMVGVAAYQERGVAGVAADTRIAAAILDEWFQFDHALATRVGVEVYESRALLTGAVTDDQTAADAVRLAWKVDGLSDVINEIQVVADTSALDLARDTWISTRLMSLITFDDEIFAINYTVETVNGTVYLIGIAQSQEELDRVIAHAEGMSYVRKVISHVRVKPAQSEG